jgi:hypothetical protein
MEFPQISAGSESKSAEAACADKAGEHSGSAESDCAKAIAQAESAIPRFATIRGTKPYTQSYRTAAQFGPFDLRLIKAILDPFP